MEKVVIVGGGASGLVTAIKAKNKKNEVIILEKNNECGKKILATGNGRCNISNSKISAPYNTFFSNNKGFFNYCLDNLSVEDMKNFFLSLGLPITELEKGNPPTVTISGAYPNLVLNFGIPTKEPTAVEYMYHGRLPIADVGGKVIQYNAITEAMILKGAADGKLTKSTPKTLGKTKLGSYNETANGDYQIVVVPAANRFTVTKDNGLGGKMIFDEETAGANGIDITINTVPCKLYGEMLTAQGETFIYID